MYENVVVVADFVGFCFFCFCFLGWFHCEERVGGGGSWSCLHFSAFSVVHFCLRFGFQKLCKTKERESGWSFVLTWLQIFVVVVFLLLLASSSSSSRQTDRREEEVVVVA